MTEHVLEIKRDYIGSADAYDIYKRNYDALIRNKLKDSNFLSAAMSRGILLERDIIEQYAQGLGLDSVFWQVQYRDTEFLIPYCSCTLDGLANLSNDDEAPDWEVWEVKTSKNDCPATLTDLKAKYPRYYYQVQFQMWRTGVQKAKILWCKCPDAETSENVYDEDGKLDITIMDIPFARVVKGYFTRNSKEFWKEWTVAKEVALKRKEKKAIEDAKPKKKKRWVAR
jgi:hypothetical protein